MKYVKNFGRYPLTYAYKKGALERKITFDKRRIYFDTGNIATAGITPVEDEVFNALQENKMFVKAVKENRLELTDKAEVSTEDEVSKLKAENEKLQRQLKKDNAAKDLKKAEEEKAKLEKENSALKVQLEALAKKNKTSKDEGF